MQISARNQLRGKVKSVKLGTIMAEVVVKVGTQEVVSAVTRGSVESLGIKKGDDIVVVIKATAVMLATP